MAPAPLLIHIGYHKTATTWMQRALFMPAHGYRQIFDHDVVWAQIAGPHGLLFDPAPARASIESGLAHVQAGEVPVISSEILSGHPFLGGRESDAFARRLAQIAPEARILVTIRDQMRILPSVYMQYVLRGGTQPWTTFFEGQAAPGYLGFVPEHFEYHRLVALYQELFGPERVHVMTQESLRAEPAQALERLARFAGAKQWQGLQAEAARPVGESYPESSAGLLRRINHIQHSTLNPRPILSFGRTPKGLYKLAGYIMKQPLLARRLGGHKPVTAHVRARFAGHFAASNRALADLVGPDLDLSDYDGIAQPR